MPSPEASRRNLGKVKRLRSYNHSLAIKLYIWQWCLEPIQTRQLRTQQNLAQVIGVCQQYVSKIARRWATEGMQLLLQNSRVESAHLEQMQSLNPKFAYADSQACQRETSRKLAPLSEFHSKNGQYATTHTVEKWQDLAERKRRRFRTNVE